MSLFSFGCIADIMLTDDDRARLVRLSKAVEEPARLLSCELEPGHRGDHYARGSAAASPPMWVRWASAGSVVIVPRPLCGTPRPGSPRGTCKLPVGHDGGCDAGR